MKDRNEKWLHKVYNGIANRVLKPDSKTLSEFFFLA